MWIRWIAVSIWNFMDPLYYACTRLRYVGQGGRNCSIFRVRLTSYRGRNITLSDGTPINKGDTLLKIHLHNVNLIKSMFSIQNEVARARHLYRIIEKSLPDLAMYVINHPEYDKVKGVIGITTLNRGCGGLGFETVQITSSCYKWIKFLTMLPIYFLSANQPLKNLRKQVPAYLFLSKNTLISKYANYFT
ncbi:hypothetical protein [Paenibacillus sp. J2TS4]|uniref:YkoP family protein n=1 Tax=Paenibacillus sp. J2TS4 TaxID=2807194 RepID=UPI001AFECD4A|nr:hypothetical protein [Paenibacillus sp. J2TS4]GIP31562.1 hypothetical protein J2TS4_07720 [Paenibacillus sp. J2TS4]